MKTKLLITISLFASYAFAVSHDLTFLALGTGIACVLSFKLY